MRSQDSNCIPLLNPVATKFHVTLGDMEQKLGESVQEESRCAGKGRNAKFLEILVDPVSRSRESDTELSGDLLLGQFQRFKKEKRI